MVLQKLVSRMSMEIKRTAATCKSVMMHARIQQNHNQESHAHAISKTYLSRIQSTASRDAKVSRSKEPDQ